MEGYCGIDIGSKSSFVCVLNNKGEVVREFKERTESISKKVRELGRFKCVVEASPLAQWLSQELEREEQEVKIICPRKAKVAMGTGKKKTDRKDAQELAKLSQRGWYEEVYRKSDRSRELRTYLVARQQIVQTAVSSSNAIRGLLRAYGIRIKAEAGGAAFLQEVREAIKGLPAFVQDPLRSLLMCFEQMRREEKRLYKQLFYMARRQADIKLLMSCPGVGPLVATAFVATIDDPKRFKNSKQLAAYLGLVPSLYQSGETEYRGRITKNGDALLRRLLVEAATVLLTRTRKDCSLKTWGLRLQDSKGFAKARVAVARKLSGILWSMWLDNAEFAYA